jgi:hypothetical protein
MTRTNASGNDNGVAGEIGYFGLGDWWLSTFNPAERELMANTYCWFGLDSNKRPLVEGNPQFGETRSPCWFLTILASWMHQPENRSIWDRIMSKAESSAGTFTDRHFFYNELLDRLSSDRYRVRSDPEHHARLTTKLRDIADKQVEIAPSVAQEMKAIDLFDALPSHPGFMELIALEREKGHVDEALRLVQIASDQGWAGAWDFLAADVQDIVPYPPQSELEHLSDERVHDTFWNYGEQIRRTYAKRSTNPDAVARTIAACECQIAISEHAAKVLRRTAEERGDESYSLPQHPGFKQLAIVREREKRYGDAIRLCDSALQQGWAGDWKKRRDRCLRAIEKSS